FLQRYERGEHQRVWHELTELGSQVWEDGPLRAEAWAVARETMTRVRANVERLVSRLRGIGYLFTTTPHAPLTGQEVALIDEYEEECGSFVPLSLRAFWEVGGAVDFRGRHPGWPARYYDPLQIYAPDRALEFYEPAEGEAVTISLCGCPVSKNGEGGVGPMC